MIQGIMPMDKAKCLRVRCEKISHEKIHLAALKALVVGKLGDGHERFFRADPRMTVLSQAMRQIADVGSTLSSGKEPVAGHEAEDKQQADAEDTSRDAVIAQRIFQVELGSDISRTFGKGFLASSLAEPANIGQAKGDYVCGKADYAKGFDFPYRNDCKSQRHYGRYEHHQQPTTPRGKIVLVFCQQDEQEEEIKKNAPPSDRDAEQDRPRTLRDRITVDRFADCTEAAVERVCVVLIVAVGRVEGDQKTGCCEEKGGEPVAEDDDGRFSVSITHCRLR